jgi:TusA-related sulfurtransferase
MSLKDQNIKLRIDAKSQVCPYPLITARRELKKLSVGDVLELEVDYEESAVKSIPDWCRKNSVPFEVVQIEDRLWRVYIQKVE